MGPWDDADMRVMRGPSATFSDPPEDKPSDNPAPTIGHIGRYALKHQLGEGGIDTVFAAHDPLLSRLIAVKTLHVVMIEAERESFNALFLMPTRPATSPPARRTTWRSSRRATRASTGAPTCSRSVPCATNC